MAPKRSRAQATQGIVGVGVGVAAVAAIGFALSKARPQRSPYSASQWRKACAASEDGSLPLAEWAELLDIISEKGCDLDAKRDVWPALLGVLPPWVSASQRVELKEHLRSTYRALLASCQRKEDELLSLVVGSPRARATATAHSSVFSPGPHNGDDTTASAAGPGGEADPAAVTATDGVAGTSGAVAGEGEDGACCSPVAGSTPLARRGSGGLSMGAVGAGPGADGQDDSEGEALGMEDGARSDGAAAVTAAPQESGAQHQVLHPPLEVVAVGPAGQLATSLEGAWGSSATLVSDAQAGTGQHTPVASANNAAGGDTLLLAAPQGAWPPGPPGALQGGPNAGAEDGHGAAPAGAADGWADGSDFAAANGHAPQCVWGGAGPGGAADPASPLQADGGTVAGTDCPPSGADPAASLTPQGESLLGDDEGSVGPRFLDMDGEGAGGEGAGGDAVGVQGLWAEPWAGAMAGGPQAGAVIPDELKRFWEAQRLIVVDAIRTDFQKHSLTTADALSSWLSAALVENSLYQKYRPTDSDWANGLWLSSLARSQLDHSVHFSGDQKRQVARLVNLLSVYAVHDPDVGYCQGMSDLALPFLLIMEDDGLAFWCFASLMTKVRRNFSVDDAGIFSQLSALAGLLEAEDATLYYKLRQVGAIDCHFAYRMIVVLMRRELPLEQVLKLWEILWADDWVCCHPAYRLTRLARTQSAPLVAASQSDSGAYTTLTAQPPPTDNPSQQQGQALMPSAPQLSSAFANPALTSMLSGGQQPALDSAATTLDVSPEQQQGQQEAAATAALPAGGEDQQQPPAAQAAAASSTGSSSSRLWSLGSGWSMLRKPPAATTNDTSVTALPVTAVTTSEPPTSPGSPLAPGPELARLSSQLGLSSMVAAAMVDIDTTPAEGASAEATPAEATAGEATAAAPAAAAAAAVAGGGSTSPKSLLLAKLSAFKASFSFSTAPTTAPPKDTPVPMAGADADPPAATATADAQAAVTSPDETQQIDLQGEQQSAATGLVSSPSADSQASSTTNGDGAQPAQAMITDAPAEDQMVVGKAGVEDAGVQPAVIAATTAEASAGGGDGDSSAIQAVDAVGSGVADSVPDSNQSRDIAGVARPDVGCDAGAAANQAPSNGPQAARVEAAAAAAAAADVTSISQDAALVAAAALTSTTEEPSSKLPVNAFATDAAATSAAALAPLLLAPRNLRQIALEPLMEVTPSAEQGHTGTTCTPRAAPSGTALVRGWSTNSPGGTPSAGTAEEGEGTLVLATEGAAVGAQQPVVLSVSPPNGASRLLSSFASLFSPKAVVPAAQPPQPDAAAPPTDGQTDAVTGPSSAVVSGSGAAAAGSGGGAGGGGSGSQPAPRLLAHAATVGANMGSALHWAADGAAAGVTDGPIAGAFAVRAGAGDDGDVSGGDASGDDDDLRAGRDGAADAPTAGRSEGGAGAGGAAYGGAGASMPAAGSSSAQLGLFPFFVTAVVCAMRRKVLDDCHDADDVLRVFQQLAACKLDVPGCVRKAREIREKRGGRPLGPPT